MQLHHTHTKKQYNTQWAIPLLDNLQLDAQLLILCKLLIYLCPDINVEFSPLIMLMVYKIHLSYHMDN